MCGALGQFVGRFGAVGKPFLECVVAVFGSRTEYVHVERGDRVLVGRGDGRVGFCCHAAGLGRLSGGLGGLACSEHQVVFKD